jgi:ABC-type transport system substrate-binding protein
MEKTTLTRRTLLRTAAVATTALAAPFVRGARAAGKVVSSGSMVLAWHTNIAPRWLEPLRHDGGATPDNFLNVAQDALIKNFRDELYDHLTLAERYEFAEDAKSATPRRWQSQRSDEGAGYPNGFTVDWATPAPNYYSRGERVVSQLQNIGIRSKLQVMERGVFLKRQQRGLKEWPGVQIIMNGARVGASWANWYESDFKCGGHLAADRICLRELDVKFDQYLASDQPAERKALAEQIQRETLENYYFVPVFRHAFVNAIGPRIAAAKWQDVFPTAMTTDYAYSWEDVELKA